MESNLKIVLAVLISFVIAFAILSLVLFTYHHVSINNEIPNENSYFIKQKFYSQKFPNEKKIFLVGSSHMGPLNSTFIRENLHNNNQDFQVYNLAESGDRPSERLKELQMIISAKPDIVVYGIAPRDFENTYPIDNKLSEHQNIFPDPSTILREFSLSFKEHLGYNLDFLENPKIDTLKIISSFMRKYEIVPIFPQPKIVDLNIPFMEYYQDNTIIHDNSELKKMLVEYYGSFNGILLPSENEDVIALKKIIDTLHKNNIKCILFLTPQNKMYLDTIPESEKQSFDEVLRNLSNENGEAIYSILDNYTNLQIWYDPTHVAINKNSIIYSKDIVGIILRGI